MATFKEEKIMEIASNTNNGVFESLSYYGEHTMNKGGRANANFLYGRVTKIVKVNNIQFGVNYENKMNNELVRNGQEPTFESAGMSGVEWVVFPKIVRSLKTGKLQMRVTCTKNTTFESEYFVDGRPATSEEIEMIKKYTPKKDLVVFNITCEKIVTWNIGGNKYTDTEILNEIHPYRIAM